MKTIEEMRDFISVTNKKIEIKEKEMWELERTAFRLGEEIKDLENERDRTKLKIWDLEKGVW